MSATFDATNLGLLRASKEVRIRTSKHKGRGVIIWVVVVDDAVFVRSVRGPKGRWYVDAAADGQASLEAGDRQFAVRVTPVADAAVIAAVSQAFLSKYAGSPYAKSMVTPETMATTLRLDPA